MRPSPPPPSQELSSSSPPPRSSKQRHRHQPRHKTYTQEEDSQQSSSYSDDDNNDNQPSNDGIVDDIDDDDDDDDVSSSNTNASFSSSSLLLHSTYINVAPLPIFRGSPSECPLTHLSRFHRVCHANNASTNPSNLLRIFPVTLDDQAALWYDLNIQPHANSSMQSWEHMESAFLNAFLTPQFIDKARSDLINLKQGEGESVSMYHLRMQWLLKKWPDNRLPDALLRGVFVDGLKEDFQDWVVLQRPETLEEAVRLAVNWEQVQSLRAKRRNNPVTVKCGFCDGGHEEGECEVRKKIMRELWMKKRRHCGWNNIKDEEEEDQVVDGGGDGGNISTTSKRRDDDHGVGIMERVMSSGRRAPQYNYCQCWKNNTPTNKLERSTSSVVSSDKKINDIAT